MKGYVYVLSNPSMPGLVKIGRSIHGGKKRAGQLCQTGVPSPFVLEFELYADDCDLLEDGAHAALDDVRVPGKEFFRIDADVAITEIMKVFIDQTGHGYRVVNPVEASAVDEVAEMAQRFDISPPDASSLLRHLPELAVRTAHQQWRDHLAKHSFKYEEACF